MRIRFIPALVGLLAVVEASAGVRVEAGWVRAMPPVATTTAAYLRLVNTREAPVTVAAAPVDWAGGAALHGMERADDGTTTMRPLDDVKLGPGETLELAPGGRHLMFTELERIPAEGERVPVCLRLNGEALCRELPVRRSAPAS